MESTVDAVTDVAQRADAEAVTEEVTVAAIDEPTRAMPRRREQKTGLLLINLGTPASHQVGDVRRYLRQFLMDGRVLDMPTWRRFLLVHLVILPRRPQRSAAGYRQIWTDRGSPLLVHGLDLRDRVQAQLGDAIPVALAMRYGEPSIGSAIDALEARGIERVVLLPLFAQSSGSALESSIAAVRAELSRKASGPSLEVVPPFFDHPAYLEAKTQLAAPVVAAVDPDLVLFSFHGVPERHLASAHPELPCLESDGCCSPESARLGCYRAQCLASAAAMAQLLALPRDLYTTAFQSRLGRARWMSPATNDVLAEHAKSGRRRVVVISGFVADCLETLEELELRGREIWLANGGEDYRLVPAPNASDTWTKAVVEIVGDSCSGSAERAVASGLGAREWR